MALTNGSGTITTSMESLSERIQFNSNKLSFLDHSRPSAGNEIRICKEQLKQDALELFRVASEPEEYIAHLSMNHQYTICLRWLFSFNILGLVPTNGSISYNNVSIEANVAESHLKSVCRMTMTSGFLCEPERERIAHTPISRLLAKNADFAAWARCVTQYMYEASSHLPKASGKTFGTGKLTISAFEAAYGVQGGFPNQLRQNPSLARDFGGFLRATQQIFANDAGHLVNGFGWTALGRATVVDVGAASIDLCERLAKAHEDLSLQLHVQSRISAQINSQYTNIPSGSQARIAVQTYKGQVPSVDEDANVFILRHMLHHFPEAVAVGLLSAMASHLLPGGTIIIADLVLPAPRTSSAYSEGMLRTRELIHKELSNGETRYIEDWEALVAKTGHGLHISKVTKPFGSDLSIIEVQIARQNGH